MTPEYSIDHLYNYYNHMTPEYSMDHLYIYLLQSHDT